jgi:hypothetical protein
MGQCASGGSTASAEELRKNKNLENSLARDQAKEEAKIKLLLLGEGVRSTYLPLSYIHTPSLLSVSLNHALSHSVVHASNSHPLPVSLSGAGECGKSTFFKQIGLLYGKPYTATERLNFRRIIHANTIQGMKIVIEDGVFGLDIAHSDALKDAMVGGWVGGVSR